MSELTDFYGAMWKDAAHAVGATMTEIRRGLWRIERGARSTLIDNYVVQIDDPVTLNVAGDKLLCHRLLAERGLTVPDHQAYTLHSLDAADAFMAKYPSGYFVVKPARGTSGARGVTTHIRGMRECRRASVLASLYGDTILIERWIPGESYRLLFLDGKMIHATRRRGRRVVGDGRSTIADLIRNDKRSTASTVWLTSVFQQRDITGTLEAQGFTLDSRPDAGAGILIQSASQPLSVTVEMRTVFDEDVTDKIGSALLEEAATAVHAIGSRFAGVDVITVNPTVSLARCGGVINEINTTPGLHHHYGVSSCRNDHLPGADVLSRLLSVPVVGPARSPFEHPANAPSL